MPRPCGRGFFCCLVSLTSSSPSWAFLCSTRSDFQRDWSIATTWFVKTWFVFLEESRFGLSKFFSCAVLLIFSVTTAEEKLRLLTLQIDGRPMLLRCFLEGRLLNNNNIGTVSSNWRHLASVGGLLIRSLEAKCP